MTWDLIAACAFGLEAVVRRELADLGIEATIGSSGRVHFRGDWAAVCRTNLWLRTADRILIRVGEFPAADFDALFDQTRAIDWGKLIPVEGSFPVTGRSIASTLTSVPAVQRSVKKALVEALRRDHEAAELPETGASFKIDVALLKDVATLTIDTTGPSLHRRGYRTDPSRAPLKETLAAALVQLSFWKSGRPLIDPFCGSGTIPIEAAMIGRRIAPGAHRDFSFTAWPGFDPDLWDFLRRDALAGQADTLEERIIGSDIDGRVLRAARENAARAGVTENIHFESRDVSAVTSRRRFGCLITNPPYGARLGAGRGSDASPGDRGFDRQLDALYQGLPDVLRKLPTWSHFILTAYPGFERTVGRTADRRRKLYNARIECTYFQFHGPRPVVESRPISADRPAADQATGQSPAVTLVHADGDAAFGALDPEANDQAERFAARLRNRAKHLRRWPTRRDITCFRLYERDVPEIPLVVDRYEDHLHIVEYERPHERDPAQHGNWLDLMAKTAGDVLEVPAQNVHLKTRRRQKGLTQHEKLAETDRRVEVREGGLRFWVNLDDYVDTGLFLDHRDTRAMVRDDASGKRVLNLFCYTGSFTVYAADGAARSTTSVDLSKTYLDWARDNLKLNQFDGPTHRFVAEDVARFVYDHRPGEAYDLIVLDPPTFSNSKSTPHDWDVQRDAVPLINQALTLLSPGGVIYFSNNFRRFKMDPDEIDAAEVREISRQTVPEDYRNRRIHRCWRIVK